MNKFDMQYCRIVVGASLLGLAWLCVGCQGFASANYKFTGEQTFHSIEYLDKFYNYDSHKIADFGTPGFAFVHHNQRDEERYRYFKSARLQDPGTQVISIRINRCFVKYLADTENSKEVLAFVEVIDHADNSAHRRVFFDDQFVAEGQYLNFSGATVFGPIPYQGQSVTIKFSVFELDQDENAVAIEAIKQIKQTIALVGQQVQPISNLIADISEALVRTNVDDRELHLVVEMHPVTVDHPLAVDSAIAGNLMRVGNYVVIKHEIRSRRADVASKMDFQDEMSWPRWVNGVSAELKAPPNILYLGGQLYITRAFNSLFGQSERDLGLPRWSDDNALATELRSLTKKTVKPSPEDFRYRTGLRKIMDEFPGFGDPDIQDVKSNDLELDPIVWIGTDYVPYRNKSYLSLTVRDDESPLSTELLASIESLSDERVGKVVRALSPEQQVEILSNVGSSIRSTVVSLIARSELRRAKSTEDMKKAGAKLKEKFGDAFGAEVDAEVAFRTEQLATLESKVPGFKATMGKMFKDEVKKQLPILRQTNPTLAVFAEKLLRNIPDEPEAGDGVEGATSDTENEATSSGNADGANGSR